MRVLYGYRVSQGQVVVDPIAATVVVAVLAWPAHPRIGIAERAVRCLLPDATRAAVRSLIQRIRAHADDYREGKPHASLPGEARLILSRSGYAAATPSCGGAVEADRHAVALVARPGRRRYVTTPASDLSRSAHVR